MIPERYDRTKICHQSYVTSKMCIFFEASWQMTRWWWSLTNSEAFGPAAACRCRVWVGFVLVAMGCPVASYQRWSQHTKGSKFWIVLGGSKPLVGQMWEIFGNLSPLELHRRITDSVETVCWVVRRFERPRPRLISVAWSQWQPALTNSVESAWTFPSSQWFSRSKVWPNGFPALVTGSTMHVKPLEPWKVSMRMATGPNSYDSDSDWNVACLKSAS